jgi:hypothetical protein
VPGSGTAQRPRVGGARQESEDLAVPEIRNILHLDVASLPRNIDERPAIQLRLPLQRGGNVREVFLVQSVAEDLAHMQPADLIRRSRRPFGNGIVDVLVPLVPVPVGHHGRDGVDDCADPAVRGRVRSGVRLRVADGGVLGSRACSHVQSNPGGMRIPVLLPALVEPPMCFVALGMGGGNPAGPVWH